MIKEIFGDMTFREIDDYFGKTTTLEERVMLLDLALTKAGYKKIRETQSYAIGNKHYLYMKPGRGGHSKFFGFDECILIRQNEMEFMLTTRKIIEDVNENSRIR